MLTNFHGHPSRLIKYCNLARWYRNIYQAISPLNGPFLAECRYPSEQKEHLEKNNDTFLIVTDHQVTN